MIVFVVTMFSNDVKYEAVKNGDTVRYSKCYKDHGYNVCENAFNSKMIVDGYWEK